MDSLSKRTGIMMSKWFQQCTSHCTYPKNVTVPRFFWYPYFLWNWAVPDLRTVKKGIFSGCSCFRYCKESLSTMLKRELNNLLFHHVEVLARRCSCQGTAIKIMAIGATTRAEKYRSRNSKASYVVIIATFKVLLHYRAKHIQSKTLLSALTWWITYWGKITIFRPMRSSTHSKPFWLNSCSKQNKKE